MNTVIRDRIAIIGGGISGMISKKYLNSYNIKSDLYELKSSLFGIWNKSEGVTWDSMSANLSQYNCCLSDQQWNVGRVYLPSVDEMRNYLEEYVKKFNILDSNVFFNKKILNISRNEKSDCYDLKILDLSENKTICISYEKIIVATGVNNSYELPSVKGIESFKGEILHSSQYKTIKDKKDKKVLVVGFSYSGSNIADEIAMEKEKYYNTENKFSSETKEDPVFMSCKQATFVLPTIWYDEKTKLYETSDTFNLRRKDTEKKSHYYDFSDPDYDYNKTYEKMTKMISESYPDVKELELIYGQKLRVTLSQYSVDLIRRKKIVLVKEIKSIDGENVTFEDGRVEKIDLIIFATGYKNDLKFLSGDILEKISYDYDNYFYPVTLYKGIFCDELKNIAFIGLFFGASWIGYELQARYAVELLIGKCKYPSKEVYDDIMEKERFLREKNKKLCKAWNVLEYCDSLADELGIFPNFEAIKELDSEFYNNVYMKLPVMSLTYKLLVEVEEKENEDKIETNIDNFKINSEENKKVESKKKYVLDEKIKKYMIDASKYLVAK